MTPKTLVNVAPMTATPLGPSTRAIPLTEPATVPLGAFMDGLAALVPEAEETGRLPASVPMGSLSAPLAPVARAVAQVYLQLARDMLLPEEVTLAPAELAAEQCVARDDESVWNWVIFPEGFSAPRLLELARLQAWTLKPANVSDEW
jgi:hypothetical protein